MKSQLNIIGLMILSLLAVSANAQIKTVQQVILQDDGSGDHLLFVINTGEYKFESCTENVATSGVGKVTIDGCKVTLRDISDTARVLAEVDLCSRAGKADVALQEASKTGRFDEPTFEVVVSDSNTGDSALTCAPKAIVPK
jgi:hypothetical protein